MTHDPWHRVPVDVHLLLHNLIGDMAADLERLRLVSSSQTPKRGVELAALLVGVRAAAALERCAFHLERCADQLALLNIEKLAPRDALGEALAQLHTVPIYQCNVCKAQATSDGRLGHLAERAQCFRTGCRGTLERKPYLEVPVTTGRTCNVCAHRADKGAGPEGNLCPLLGCPGELQNA